MPSTLSLLLPPAVRAKAPFNAGVQIEGAPAGSSLRVRLEQSAGSMEIAGLPQELDAHVDLDGSAFVSSAALEASEPGSAHIVASAEGCPADDQKIRVL